METLSSVRYRSGNVSDQGSLLSLARLLREVLCVAEWSCVLLFPAGCVMNMCCYTSLRAEDPEETAV